MYARSALIIFLSLFIGLFGLGVASADPGQPPPPQDKLPGQPNPDVYTCCGLGAIDYLNEVQKQMVKTGQVLWRYSVEPGCEGLDQGRFKGIIQESQQIWADEIGIQWKEDNANGWDFTFSCGVAFRSLCPGAAGCLAHSWPYNGRIDFDGPTILNYAFRDSQVAVITHEICHQILTCNEQYNIASFSCIPGWGPDFMNCGPDSRYGFTPITKERVKRIGYPVALPQAQTGYGFNGAWYVYACGFDVLHASRLSVLIDRHDGKGEQWAGIFPAIVPNGQGCMGVGLQEGLKIEIGARYFLKQESPFSAFKWYNETVVRGSN